MGLEKLTDFARKLDLPNLVVQGTAIAAQAASFASQVKVNADRARHVLTDGDRAEIDAIHAEAMAKADALDAQLAAAEKR